jgi:hypothetical protein
MSKTQITAAENKMSDISGRLTSEETMCMFRNATKCWVLTENTTSGGFEVRGSVPASVVQELITTQKATWVRFKMPNCSEVLVPRMLEAMSIQMYKSKDGLSIVAPEDSYLVPDTY